MKRDKDRESQIISLSAIAKQLKDMMPLNQTSYLESIVHMNITRYEEGNFHFLKLKNNNPKQN